MTFPKLEKAIRDACPETLELSFGCRMRSGKGVYTLVIKRDEGMVWSNGHTMMQDEPSLIKKIIGHELTLAHVLRTAVKLQIPNFPFLVENLFYNRWYDSESIDEPAQPPRWDLTKNYAEQSDETKQFLENIICQ